MEKLIEYSQDSFVNLLEILEKLSFKERVILKLKCPRCSKIFEKKSTVSDLKHRCKEEGTSFLTCRFCRQELKKQELSEEEKILRKKKRSEISKAFWENVDSSKKLEMKEKRAACFRNWFDNLDSEEKGKLQSTRSIAQKKRFSKEEERQKISKGIKKFWEQLPEDVKKEISQKRSETRKINLENLSEEELEDLHLLRTLKGKEVWDALPTEVKESRNKKISEKRKDFLANNIEERFKLRNILKSKTKEEKEKIVEKQKETFSKKTKEEKDAIRQKQRAYWVNLSEEEKDIHKEAHKRWWDSQTESFKERWSLRCSEIQKEVCRQRTLEERRDIRRKANKHNFYKSQDGEVFDSLWELKYYEYCKSEGYEIVREPVELTFEYEGKSHHCYPDFSVNGKLVEVKGTQFFKDGKMINPYNRKEDGLYEAKHQCMLENQVQFLSQEELKKLGLKI